MLQDNILQLSDIVDDSGKIRPRFCPQEAAGLNPHGEYFGINEDGRRVVQITYSHGVVHGPYLDFWSTGGVACEGQFVDGFQDGVWHYYHKDGTLMEIVHFKHGNAIN
jgi:antitoxin component YwqK of YwqJK toxin-antitoxin module